MGLCVIFLKLEIACLRVMLKINCVFKQFGQFVQFFLTSVIALYLGVVKCCEPGYSLVRLRH